MTAPRHYPWVAAGGAVGAMTRAWMLAGAEWREALLLLLAINVGGSVLLAWLHRLALPTRQMAMMGVGFCGSFTSVSALSAQSLALVESGRADLALGYLALQVVCSLPLVWVLLRTFPAPAPQATHE